MEPVSNKGVEDQLAVEGGHDAEERGRHKVGGEIDTTNERFARRSGMRLA